MTKSGWEKREREKGPGLDIDRGGVQKRKGMWDRVGLGLDVLKTYIPPVVFVTHRNICSGSVSLIHALTTV